MSGQRAGDQSGDITPTAPSPGIDASYSNPDWTPRPSSRSRFAPRRSSTASSVSSGGGSLDITSHTRTSIVKDQTQNAISTLLQPPILRTGLLPHTSLPASAAHRAPTTRDIPPVALTNIPHVDNSTFGSYLAQVGPLYDARSRADGDGSSTQWLRRDRNQVDELSGLLDQTLRAGDTRPRLASRQSSTTSIATISTISTISQTEPPHPRRKQSGGIRTRSLAPTPLSSIPNVYFDENFHLENPRTFDIVSERSEVVRPPQTPADQGKSANGSANGATQPPRKALATNAILQEKLSWYLDTVEIHLISSISTASKSFFAALGSLKELHSDAAESVAKIRKLREDLVQLDTEMALGGLEIVKMKQRRENLRKLSEATYQLQCIVDGATHCEELVTNGELENAIDRIQTLEDFTCGRLDSDAARDISWLCPELPRQLLDLRQLNALDGFPEGMDQLRYRIGKGYEARFIDALLTDLRHYIENAQVGDTLRRWARKSSANPPAYLQTNTMLRKELSATIQGLNRAKHTTTATKTFRDQIVKEIKGIIRQHLPSSSDDDADSTMSSSTRSSRTPASRQEKSAILARNLRALSADDAEELFTKIYCRVGEALRRLQVQVRLLLDISSGQATVSPKSPPPKSPMLNTIDATVAKNEATVEVIQTLDLSSLLGQAVDAAQTQITRLLKVRNDEVTQTSPPQFLRYVTLNRLFADECETVSGRSGAGLRGVVDMQIKEFIGVMVEKERQHLAQTMEEDKWDAWDFTETDDTLLSDVLHAMQTDPAHWLAQTHVWECQQAQSIDVATTNQSTTTTTTKPPETNGAAAAAGKDKEKTRPASIDSEKYNLVKSSILLLHGLARFESVVCCIPRMADTLSTAILDYLRLFNSRCNQLVLFAGATRSAGLANINTKHLALASQALGFIVALVPYLREFVRRKMPGGAGGGGRDKMAGFDAVMRETQRNQMGIHDKLVDIMGARATAHVNAMRKIDFDAQAGDDNGRPSPHMETLTKETGLLHRVLSRHLPEVSVRMVMGPVFGNYREQWGKAFSEVAVKTEGGKQRLMRDAELFDSKLTKIDGAGDLGSFILNLVKEKQVDSALTSQLGQSKTTNETESTESSGREAPGPSRDAS